MMRVLVVGADGFVGARVAKALTESGWATPVTSGAAVNAQAVASVDAIANCRTGSPDGILRVAQDLYGHLARSNRAIPVVHLSSMTVYGSATGVVDESGALRGDLGPYAQAQIAAEKLAADYSASVRLRPGCEYGPDCTHWSGTIARCLRQGRLGDLGAWGDGRCNLLYIDDLVAVILQALRRPELAGQAFNLAMPDAPTWNEYFIRFARVLGAVPVRRVTRRRLKVESKMLAAPLRISERILSRVGVPLSRLTPALTPSLLRTCGQDIRLDVRVADKAFALQWTPLQKGLEQAADWVRNARR